MNKLGLLFAIAIVIIVGQSVSAQVYFQLERANFVEPHKFLEGDPIWYKMKGDSDWQRQRISALYPGDETVIFGDVALEFNDITHIGVDQPWAKIVGGGLMTFGTSWYVFGGLAHFATDDFQWGWDTTVIGGVGLGFGYAISKLFHRKSIQLGDRARIRIIDLRFPAPEANNGFSSSIGLQMNIPLNLAR